MAKASKAFRARVKLDDGRRVMATVPVPTVVGVTRAAELLGVPKSNVSRLRTQGRMPEPVPQEGPGAPVWLRGDVEALAAQLAEEREARRSHEPA